MIRAVAAGRSITCCLLEQSLCERMLRQRSVAVQFLKRVRLRDANQLSTGSLIRFMQAKGTDQRLRVLLERDFVGFGIIVHRSLVR